MILIAEKIVSLNSRDGEFMTGAFWVVEAGSGHYLTINGGCGSAIFMWSPNIDLALKVNTYHLASRLLDAVRRYDSGVIPTELEVRPVEHAYIGRDSSG